MKRHTLFAAATFAMGIAPGISLAQQPASGPQPFFVGNRLGLPITPAPNATFTPMSSNVKVYGAIFSAESCSYDPGRGVIVVPQPERRPERANQQRVHVRSDQSRRLGPTARWIGVQNPGSDAPA